MSKINSTVVNIGTKHNNTGKNVSDAKQVQATKDALKNW